VPTFAAPAGLLLACSRVSQPCIGDGIQPRPSMWIMDPAVQTVANTIRMPDYVLDAARSSDLPFADLQLLGRLPPRTFFRGSDTPVIFVIFVDTLL
jgi:hypothetical protein